jgi:hypothetical protein
MKEADIAIIGAGISGVSAAVTAAKSGCRTLLLEKSSLPGGIAVKGNINTICGLFIDRPGGLPEMLYNGFAEEFASRLMSRDSVESPRKMGRVYVLLSRTKTMEETIQALLESESKLSVKYLTTFCGVRFSNDRICHIDAIMSGRRYEIKVGAVVDCSGDAVVCRSAGVPVIGPDESNQVPAMIFPLINIDNPCHFSMMTVRLKVLLKQAVNQGVLPQGAEAVSLLPMLEKDSIAVKINMGRFVNGFSKIRKNSLDENANELKNHIFRFFQKQVVGFERCQIPDGEYSVQHRDGIKAKGLYVLSGQDVLNGRKFSNAAAKGCWPIEKWDSAGNLNIRYLTEGGYYEIPEQSLRVAGIKNLMVAGKCISADNDAHASARVIGTCLATGEAAAKLAVRSLT